MKSNQLVVLTIDDKIYSIYLPAVERIVHAVEITPLPKAPPVILGIINYQGTIIPVINSRKLFLLPERETDIKDKLVIANTSRRTVALIADSVLGIEEFTEDEMIKPDDIVPGISFIEGVIKRNDEIIMIYDLDSFLGLEEENKLGEIIAN